MNVARTLSGGGTATHAALADLNGDGVPDAAFACWVSYSGVSYVSVCMGLGNGVFAPPVPYNTGPECCAVEIADLNRDGRPDLAAANASGNTISILFNRGDGTFAAPVYYPVGSQPRSLKIGDLDGDGRPDIAVMNCLSNDVSILFNRGDGTFLPEVRVPVGNVTQRGDPNLTFAYPGPFLALGDFNGDHALDIAVPCPTRIKLLINDSAGHFTLAATNPSIVGSSAYCIAVGDLNNDGSQDLAVAVTGADDHGLSILLARGDGTFNPAVAYDVNPVSYGNFVFTNHVAIGDIDGDGQPDLAIGHEEGHGFLTLLRNRGDGTFFPKQLLNSDYRSWYVGFADLCNRGRNDLTVLTSHGSSPFKVHLNDGAGSLLSYSTSSMVAGISTYPQSAALADIDGDGVPDLVATISGAAPTYYQAQVSRGLGDGTFAPPATMSFPTTEAAIGWGLAVADLNGDHQPDLVISDPIVPGGGPYPGRIWVALHTTGLNFSTPVAYPLDGVTPTSVVAVDLNGDGRPDIAAWAIEPPPTPTPTSVVRRSVQVLINRGDGTFDPPVGYITDAVDLWSPWGDLAAADLDHDGRPELIATVSLPQQGQPGSVVVLHNRGDGTFELWSTVQVGTEPVKLIAADFSGDGYADLAVMHEHGGTPPPFNQAYLTILYNDRTGHFPTRSEYIDAQFIPEYAMTAADFDGDGKLDLALADSPSRSVLIHLNHGDGTFEPPVAYGVLGPAPAGWSAALLASDLNSSGRTSLLAIQQNGRASFLPNLACRNCYANCDGSTQPPILTISDFLCFLNRFATADPAANCDQSTTPPTLNILDFTCFLNAFAAGCP